MRTVIREGHWWNESSRMSNVFKIERNFEKFKKYSLLSDEILREYTEQTLLFKSFDEIFDDRRSLFDNEEPSKSAVASVLKSRGVKCFFLPVRCDQYNDAIGRAYHNENRFPFIALTDYHLAIGYNGKTIFIPIEKVVSFSLYAGENNGEYHKQDFTYYRKKSPVAGAIVGGAIGGSTGAVVGALAHNGTEQRTERSYWAKYTYHLEIAIEEDVFVFGGLIEHLNSTRKSLVRHSNSMTINKYLGVDSPEKVRSTFIQLKDKLATSGKHPIDLTAQKSGNSSLTGPQAFIVIVLFVLLILILCYLIVFVI